MPLLPVADAAADAVVEESLLGEVLTAEIEPKMPVESADADCCCCCCADGGGDGSSADAGRGCSSTVAPFPYTGVGGVK